MSAIPREQSAQGGEAQRDTKRTGTGSIFSKPYAGSPWLTVTGILMLIDTAISLVGLVIDPTLIVGAPAWLKPLKFGISTSLFCFTLAYMIGHLIKTRRVATILGNVMAVALVPEIALIDMQAARHTTSHFNTAAAFDAAVYGAMGMIIGVVFTASILLFIVTCFETFADRALGLSIRLGLLLALLGMSTGVFMATPTRQQLAEAHKTGAHPHSGAHSVGGPDGGPSLPITGWSTDHGDLRIAHFIGLHAMQVLLLAWWFTRKRAGWAHIRQVRLVALVGMSLALAFVLTLWQALRAQPFLKPDALTLSGWASWLTAVLIGLSWIALTRNKESTPQLEMTR